MSEQEEIELLSNPITDASKLEALLALGYTIEGPRPSSEANQKAVERFFTRGYEFFPESCLKKGGCQLVEPSALTKGLKFAYKCEGEDMYRWHKSQYTLVKEEIKIPLYLKLPEH
jgi:hypothetical protein